MPTSYKTGCKTESSSHVCTVTHNTIGNLYYHNNLVITQVNRELTTQITKQIGS